LLLPFRALAFQNLSGGAGRFGGRRRYRDILFKPLANFAYGCGRRLLFHFIFLLGVAGLGFITGYSLSLGLFQLIGVTVFPELFFLIGIICACWPASSHVFIILGTSFSGASQVVQGIFGLISCKTLEEFYALQESFYTPAGKGELAGCCSFLRWRLSARIFQFKGMSAKDKKRIR
jgi:hypothetical protein